MSYSKTHQTMKTTPKEVHTNCALCFNPFPPVPAGGGAAGYAVTRDGSHICYACADAQQREELKDREPFSAYLSSDGKTITTWTGGKLMDIAQSWPCTLTRNSHWHSAKSYRSIRAVDVHGAKWYGRGSAGVCITLRPMKG